MNRFEVSLFGIRINARGTVGIVGVSLVTAMVLAYLYYQMPAPLAGPSAGCLSVQDAGRPAIVDPVQSGCFMSS